jgi:hypothetical protein
MSTKPKKKSIPKVVKDLSWNKWIGEDVARAKCMCCGVNEIKMSSFHCGHVIAEANGGKLSIENLKPICSACNLSMRTENMDEFRNRCGFTSAPKVVALSEADIKKAKIEQLLINGSLTRCRLSENPRNIFEVYTRYEIGCYAICETHCSKCDFHYNNIKFESCPCISSLV